MTSSRSGGRLARRPVTIFTIGHGTRPIEELIALLQGERIRRLVDVRTAPGSRRNPQFGKTALVESLEKAGIEYVWRKDLGGWRTPRPDSRHTAVEVFRGYADYMDTEEFQEARDWLLSSSRRQKTAFMCAESLWWKCHRRMIADALTVKGARVLHLMTGGRVEKHRLHPTARRARGKLVYDRPAPRRS